MSDANHDAENRLRLSPKRVFWLSATLALTVAVAAFGVTALLVNIFERKQEARNPFFRVVEITDETEDPAVWGKNFPLQYDLYKRTVDMQRTKFGGSEALPRTPTEADPRSQVAQSRLELDPRLKTMWAGYAFAIDFREERGHAYMLEDQTFTERQQKPQVGACIHCHASVYVPYKKLGGGDLIKGFEMMNPMPYQEARKLVEHPVACIDCHNPETMELRITRPAFLEGISLVKAAEGIPDYDVNKMATRQEMRVYVCGQCHVEYYFKGDEKRLTYPWHNGYKADDVLAYYDSIDFQDWKHADTGAPMLKAQHPEFESWNQGIHARAGVACADCHMPYVRVGAMKVSDHHVRSPLLNINNACQTCHRAPEDELKARAENIQTKTFEMRDMSMAALMDLIEAIKKGQTAGTAPERLDEARRAQRRASFLIDWVEAENSSGFHASQEIARILFKAMDHIRKGQIALAAGESPSPAAAQ
ncbi:MAG TPA: ammonia-forming cytochrome c nitrite reductase subunit c552 [Candidatus Hydrogenedentes bacterium]|nr:ammonia-forming cytochrome c nitrite reductase subunit c552 [Candidatus Hydrogenedentota bacterium]HQH52290.1 ammonia-forming cytochrome c nitrite reductase subunit c552 [Candidatus Hydrogenedentota bacterium]HQM50389.1 ammonia-forming cytochrome c nitrite reductase subunit c552 [Candidatus Hydrogenedentota bacterium]